MTVAETPIAALLRGQRTTGDGLHLVARTYKKGVRLDTHMHREAQLVYAAKGTMQVTTPEGRWLVPPDRAVWVPALLEHSIDVLADIQMRTLYFDLAWLEREARGDSLDAEFVVRVSPLLHQAILALFEPGNDRERTSLLLKLAMLELDRAEVPTSRASVSISWAPVGSPSTMSAARRQRGSCGSGTVSYTHLTLPAKRIV